MILLLLAVLCFAFGAVVAAIGPGRSLPMAFMLAGFAFYVARLVHGIG